MLDPFIIDEILRKEKELDKDLEQPQIQLEIPLTYEEPPQGEEQETNRGVAVIDF